MEGNLKLHQKRRKAAGCAAVILDFTGSVFAPRAPHPAPPAVCAQ